MPLFPIDPNALVKKAGDTMTGELYLQSQNSADGTTRLHLETYEQTSTVADYAEVLRIDSKTSSAKGAIAWRTSDLQTQAWAQMHDYLFFYATNTVNSVDDPGDTFNVPSHGLPTGWQVTLTTTGTLPTGLATATIYYVRAVNANTLTFFNTATDAVNNTSKITFTGTGSGTIQVVPNNNYNYNRHKHWGVEVSDSAGAKQTRLSIPYGFDTTEVSVFNGNLNVARGILRIWNDAGNFRQLMFANTPAGSYLPPLDATIARWTIAANDTAESGSSTGSDMQVSRFDDSGSFIDAPLFIKRSSGRVGIGTTSPSGALHIKAGGAAASGAPIKLTAGTNLTTPEAGAVEYDGSNLFFTGTAALRGAVTRILFSQTATGTVTSTASETTTLGTGIGTATLPANFFVAGRTVRLVQKGVISTTGTPTLVMKIKLGSVVLTQTATVTLPNNMTNYSYTLEADYVCRAAGSSGTFVGEGKMLIDNVTVPFILGFPGVSTVTVDTTTSQVLDLSATFGTANSSNTIGSKSCTLEALY